MFGPLLTIALSVALGTALGILPGALPRVTSPLRTFAVVAAAAVVGLHFLPHTLESKGAWGLLVVALSFLAVLALERLNKRVSDRKSNRTTSPVINNTAVSDSAVSDSAVTRTVGNETVGLGLSYAALLLHRVGDGAAMAASEHGEGVLLALGAHAIPVVALVTLGYRRRSLQEALWRAALLGIVGALSFLGAASLPSLAGENFHGWLDAVATGVLLHIVVHELKGGIPRRTGERLLDALAAIAGALLVIAPFRQEEGPNLNVGSQLLELTLHTAPMLLLGLFGGALLQALGPKLTRHWLTPRGAISDALRGTLYGAPLPLCSCSVLPISRGLKKGGAGPALVVAFLIATPELGLETLTLTVQLLGWPFAMVRLAGALVVAFIAGLTVAAFATSTGNLTSAPIRTPAPAATSSKQGLGELFGKTLFALEDLCLHIGGWITLGLLAAAYANALIPDNGLVDSGSLWIQLLVVSAVAVPSYVCAPSATPVAAALLLKGLSPGAILVGLLLGPATNIATLLFLRKSFGVRALVAMITAVIASTWALAWATNLWLPLPKTTQLQTTHDDSWLSWLSMSILCVLLLKNIWSVGIRGWLAASLSGGENEESGHAHAGHAHGHSHGHGHSH